MNPHNAGVRKRCESVRGVVVDIARLNESNILKILIMYYKQVSGLFDPSQDSHAIGNKSSM